MEHTGDLGRLDHRKPKPSAIRSFVTHQPKEMMAICPLFVMVAFAFGLAGVTLARHLTVSPAVQANKKKRVSADEIPEMKYADELHRKGREYVDGSPIHKLVKGKIAKPRSMVEKLSHVPPVLPGDEPSATGVVRSDVNTGRRGGGI